MTSLEFAVPNPRSYSSYNLGIEIIGAAKSAMQGRDPFDCPVKITITWRLNYTKANPHLPLTIYKQANELCQTLIGERFVICESWQPYELHVVKTHALNKEELTVRIEELK